LEAGTQGRLLFERLGPLAPSCPLNRLILSVGTLARAQAGGWQPGGTAPSSRPGQRPGLLEGEDLEGVLIEPPLPLATGLCLRAGGRCVLALELTPGRLLALPGSCLPGWHLERPVG
jgi:hypothetical protein